MELSAAVRRRRLIRTRLKGLIRTIIINKIWISSQEQEPISSNVQRNLAILTRRQRKNSILTVADKGLIRKDKSVRTVEERKGLVKLIASIACFSNISPKIRARITPYLHYIYIEANRTIFKEGHKPAFVYFILNGEGIATQKVYNEFYDSYTDKPCFIFGSGDTIGGSNFIQNEHRSFNFKVTRDVEALFLDGDDFIELLLPTLTIQWNRKVDALESFGYFSDWTSSQMSFACQNGDIKQFEPMDTIYHEDSGILNHVYFIISGECMILQHLKMKSKDDTIDNHFTDVGSLRFGAIFGLGETMEQRAIIARTMVQCLLLPRYWLFERAQNPGNMWQRMIFYLNSKIPSKSQLFKAFINSQKWNGLKKRYIKELLAEPKLGNPTKIEDIPVYCRVIEKTFDE